MDGILFDYYGGILFNYYLQAKTLFVPQNCSWFYYNAGYDKYFGNIVEGDPSSVHNVTVDEVTEEIVYDLNGRKMKDARKGVNIIGGKKVVVK